MCDASFPPMEENIRKTRAYVRRKGHELLIESACDKIVDASGEVRCEITYAEKCARYMVETGVDVVVANDQIGKLFDDGICKVNIWTALERGCLAGADGVDLKGKAGLRALFSWRHISQQWEEAFASLTPDITVQITLEEL